MTSSLHVLNFEVRNRVGIDKNSVQSALEFIKIIIGLPLTCSYDIVLKK